MMMFRLWQNALLEKVSTAQLCPEPEEELIQLACPFPSVWALWRG